MHNEIICCFVRFSRSLESSRILMYSLTALSSSLIVRKIFKLCIEGYGPLQIAKRLTAEGIPTPSAHFAEMGTNGNNRVGSKWDQRSVRDILEKVEYAGHTANFKTTKKSYKCKKRIFFPKADWLIFENTRKRQRERSRCQRKQGNFYMGAELPCDPAFCRSAPSGASATSPRGGDTPLKKGAGHPKARCRKEVSKSAHDARIKETSDKPNAVFQRCISGSLCKK